MPGFDSRALPYRPTPRQILVLAGLTALSLAALPLMSPSPPGSGPHRPPAPRAPSATLPGFTAPFDVPVKVQRGETLEGAVRRIGVAPAEARRVVGALAQAFDPAHIRAGLALDAKIAQPRDHTGPARLLGLTLRTGPATTVTLSPAPDGALRIQKLEERVREETQVAQGAMTGSLYQSAEAAGASPALTADIARLFSHKLDFSRDIQPGDRFRLVFDRKVTGDGRIVQTGDLLYAEIAAKGAVTRFYRYQRPGSSTPEFFDETGKNIKGFLLRTPVDGARVTSGFGMRMHPILGYTRMHQGIDFGVPRGTPVFAAGDGVVEEARWAGGYGRWMKLRHTGGWETAYGHLSGWAARAGQQVRQGQVIAYSGSTGESTGPHLHYEVMQAGRKVDPKSAKVPAGTLLVGRDLAAFKIQKAHIDGLLAGAAPAPQHLAGAETVLRR